MSLTGNPMKLFVLSLALFAQSGFADSELTWFTVSPIQYEKAPCKSHVVPDYDGWLAQQIKNRRDHKAKGFEFEDQPKNLISAFGDLTKNLPRQESTCQTIICAVDEIWGAPLGRMILYVRARHGFNPSEHAFPETRQLSSDELEDILITLADLPPGMEAIGKNQNQRMVLAAEGKTHPLTPEAMADAGITFYDKWRNTSVFNKRYGLFHEFGHNVSELNGNLDASPEWMSLSASCHVSIYGNVNNRESFAESFVMYRFNGPELQKICPKKYEFLKEKAFSGREYLDESQCL